MGASGMEGLEGEDFKGLGQRELDMRLRSAAVDGDAERASKLLAAGADAAEVDYEGRAPLMIAASRLREQCVRELLPASDLALSDARGRTALMHAALAEGDAEGLVELLAKGSDLEARDEGGRTALALAALGGRLPAARALLAAGADPASRDSTGATPLMLSAQGPDGGCVELLLAVSDASAAQRDGMTALMFAAYHGQMEAAELLLRSGGAGARCSAGQGSRYAAMGGLDSMSIARVRSHHEVAEAILGHWVREERSLLDGASERGAEPRRRAPL